MANWLYTEINDWYRRNDDPADPQLVINKKFFYASVAFGLYCFIIVGLILDILIDCRNYIFHHSRKLKEGTDERCVRKMAFFLVYVVLGGIVEFIQVKWVPARIGPPVERPYLSIIYSFIAMFVALLFSEAAFDQVTITVTSCFLILWAFMIQLGCLDATDKGWVDSFCSVPVAVLFTIKSKWLIIIPLLFTFFLKIWKVAFGKAMVGYPEEVAQAQAEVALPNLAAQP